MGASGSTLVGKAVVTDLLLPYTAWGNDEILAARTRVAEELGGKFALDLKDFTLVMQIESEEAATPLFTAFDTDENGLVDAFEVLGVVAMAGQMPTRDRVEFMFNLYDFNKSGSITKDEMVIMHNTLIIGCCKFDKKIAVPPVEFLEDRAEQAFKLADMDSSGAITMEELHGYTTNIPAVANFLEYWDDCLAVVTIPDGELWEDPDFLPNGSSLYKNPAKPPPGAVPPQHVQWLRPSEFTDSPSLWVGTISASDVVQGLVGDCWFLSAVAVMASRPDLLEDLFVKTGQEASGRYCVKLYKDGDWVYMYVDDRIPCNMAGKPLYAHSTDGNELWPMLLEKAYAKAHGSYEALTGGYTDYALKDLTGGVPEALRLDSKSMAPRIESGEMWDTLKAYFDDGLLGASHSRRSRAAGGGGVEAELMDGILQDHAYGVLELVDADGERLLHVRNPWGMGEWRGPWSDGSVEWDECPEVAAACKYTGPVQDGCFWIAYEDFVEVFNTVYSCRLLPPEDGWIVHRRRAAWTKETAGGCLNFKSWTRNQQFALDLPLESEVVVSLSQPDARFHVHRGPNWNKYETKMGFIVVEFDWDGADGGSMKRATRVTRDTMKGFTQPFRPLRDLTVSLTLAAGKYVIVPMTFEPQDLGEFVLTVYSTSLGFDVIGGTEVTWDEPTDADDDELDEGLTINAAPPKKGPPAESSKTAESQAVNAMYDTVRHMADMLIALEAKRDALKERVAALEGAA